MGGGGVVAERKWTFLGGWRIMFLLSLQWWKWSSRSGDNVFLLFVIVNGVCVGVRGWRIMFLSFCFFSMDGQQYFFMFVILMEEGFQKIPCASGSSGSDV